MGGGARDRSGPAMRVQALENSPKLPGKGEIALLTAVN